MIKVLSLPVIVLSLTVIVATPARAQSPDLPPPYSPVLVSRDFTFGMVGLAPGQTARLNVVNVESVNNAALPCRLSLSFFDDGGKILKQSVVQVDGAKAVFLDLTWEETPKRAGASNTNRIQIRAVGYNPLLALPPSAPQPAIPITFSCNVIPTLELFTSETGISSVVLTDSVSLNRIVPPLQLAGPAARVRTNLARDVACVVRGQEHIAERHFFGLTRTPEWNIDTVLCFVSAYRHFRSRLNGPVCRDAKKR